MIYTFLLSFIIFLATPAFSVTVRIKEIAAVKGNRTNELMGMGLVVGLNGTGDSPASLTTNKVVANMITRLGIETSPEGVITQSVASVIVTAEMPAFSQNGTRVDAKIAVIGDATSLVGGTLVATQLKAGDGQVYAIASGPIMTAQASGVGAQSFTAMTIPNGAVVEREFSPDIVGPDGLELTLLEPDFTTALRVADAINERFKGYYANSLDPMRITVKIPPLYQEKPVEYISMIESLQVDKDAQATVVINERTGTIVMGAHITIQPVVIAHGELSIQVGEPEEGKTESVMLMKGATVGELVKSLNLLGTSPKDLVSILQAVKAAGAINAKLKTL